MLPERVVCVLQGSHQKINKKNCNEAPHRIIKPTRAHSGKKGVLSRPHAELLRNLVSLMEKLTDKLTCIRVSFIEKKKVKINGYSRSDKGRGRLGFR